MHLFRLCPYFWVLDRGGNIKKENSTASYEVALCQGLEAGLPVDNPLDAGFDGGSPLKGPGVISAEPKP
jgi:hypothetical protein